MLNVQNMKIPVYTMLNENSSLVAGLFAGMAGVTIGHPLDTLKTRMQVNVGIFLPDKKLEGSAIGKFAYLQQLRSLYRGILPPLITTGVVQSFNFSLYEKFKRYFSDEKRSHLSTVFISGTLAGSFVSLLTGPIGVIIFQQQIVSSKGIISVVSNICRCFGVSAFYRGFGPLFLMESFGRGIYLWTYESVKMYIERNNILDQSNLVTKVCAAATAGCFSWMVVYPCDVIKSRVQVDLSRSIYKSSIDCLKRTWKEGGIRALNRGITFTMIRAAPVASAVLPIYEITQEYLESKLQ